jgi:hypothetical protein
MPPDRRWEKRHKVMTTHILTAKRECPICHGVCFVSSLEEHRRRLSGGRSQSAESAQFSTCHECGGKGYSTA